MEDIANQLPIETQFQLVVFDQAVDSMSLEQARDYLKRSHRLYIGMRQLYLQECIRNAPVMTRNEFNKRPTA